MCAFFIKITINLKNPKTFVSFVVSEIRIFVAH